VAYRGSDFRRGASRNIDEVRRMAAAGRVTLLFDTEVAALAPGRGGDAGAVAATLSPAATSGASGPDKPALRPGPPSGADPLLLRRVMPKIAGTMRPDARPRIRVVTQTSYQGR